ncbi:MAG: IS3 family transposase, partial [Firmicutes bacterium]|nr:IS3 family transposase [Candidatus Enteromonas pullistercoris]
PEFSSKDEEIKWLRERNAALKLRSDVLAEAAKLAKKETGIDYGSLKAAEKAGIVDALANKHPVASLLKELGLARSTYYYHAGREAGDPYGELRKEVARCFADSRGTYGYRRLKAAVEARTGRRVSEKVVRRLMKDGSLAPFRPRMRKYSSYVGEPTPAPENLLARDFSASAPFEKIVTDITEFSLRDGKVYLSPAIDLFVGAPIAWTIGKSPTGELASEMLRKAHDAMPGARPIVHSDRGFHYRTGEWIALMDDYGYVRSMSKKGCSPDNAAAEGFFGTLKNEFFYGKDWSNVRCDEFIAMLDEYLTWFCQERIKERLGFVSPRDYLISAKSVQL